MERRVVITGIGAITPIGNNAEEFWNGLKEGKCGIGELTQFDASDYKVKFAAEVKNYNENDYFDIKQAKRLERFTQFAVIAAREAFKDSGLTNENIDMNRVGVLVSSGIGGLRTIEIETNKLQEKGWDRVSPIYIPKAILNMAAGNVSIELGAKGETEAIVSSCAGATNSIGQAYRMIKHGYEDAVVAGGSESSITPTGIAGFANMKALTTAENKNRASIPFDKERSGFVMGEGAGIVILEELENAKNRGAKIYAEIIGYGSTADSYHITSPDLGGEGAARAMVRAVEDAKITFREVDYINAHGTSTPLNDMCETRAIKVAFGADAYNVKVSSTKSSTGHLLGAAGGVEAIACIKAVKDDFLPATINYQIKDEDCDLNLVVNSGINQRVNVVMSNSLGFGGHNASIIFRKYE